MTRIKLENYKNILNIFLPLILTITIFYSGSINQKITQIYSDINLEMSTINISFVTLSIKAALNDAEGYKRVIEDMGDYMENFFKVADEREGEKQALLIRKKWIDRIVYLLSLLLLMINGIDIKRLNSYITSFNTTKKRDYSKQSTKTEPIKH